MTFDYKIYNKQNLKEEDRQKLDLFQEKIENVIDKTEFDYEVEPGILGAIRTEVIGQFVEELKKMFGFELQNMAAEIIDNYEEEVKPVEDPITYEYEGE